MDKKYKGSKIRTRCYADKWQWLFYNESEPWKDDDDDELELDCRCVKFKKHEIFIWKLFSKWRSDKFKDRVPFRTTGYEKVEMRKWMWDTLSKKAKLKLKLAWMADQNVKYYKRRTLAKILRTPFKTIWLDVQNAEIHPIFKMLHRGAAKRKDELMNYTLMRVEDTVGYEDPEPWMLAVDPCKDEELRVMFDNHNFWRTESDEILQRIRMHNKLVPPHGYFTCSQFTKMPDQTLGFKRYVVYKPDNTQAKLELTVKLKHVLPLMRYTDGFKCNVGHSQLDLPYRDDFDLILHKSKKHEEFNYTIERSTILASIFVLAWDPGGMWCATLFLLTRLIVWLAALRQAFKGRKDEIGDHTLVDKSTQTLLQQFMPTRAESKILLQSFVSIQVLIMFFQVLVLIFLTFGQLGMPGQLCAIYCILVCIVSMISMNAATAMKQLEKTLKELQESFENLLKSIRAAKYKAIAFINGDNFLGITFYAMEERKETEKLADRVALVVPDLGITFDGNPDIAQGLAPEEVRSLSLLKKVVPHYMPDEDDDGERYRSPKEHPRFDTDISTSLYLAVDLDQMMMRKSMPQIMATIQCVNHPTSQVCNPQFDSYLTLFKRLPNGERWDEDWDLYEDVKKEKTTELLEGWKNDLDSWLDTELGAVEGERTATKQIKDDIYNLV
jgi:hypothetical protein